MSVDLLDMPARDQLSALYVAYFGRAPDPAGLDFWVEQRELGLQQGKTASEVLGDIASSFAIDAEAREIFAFLDSPLTAGEAEVRDFVTAVFQNLFNREPEPAGLEFWTQDILDRIDSGDSFVGQAIVDIVSGAQDGRAVDTDGDGVADSEVRDATTVTNKIGAGALYAQRFAESGARWTIADDREGAVSVIDPVDADAASLDEAGSAIEALVEANLTNAGVVTDGFVVGATVFADRDGDGEPDPDEPTATTDETGEFAFDAPAGGPLVASGGTDIVTGLPLEGTLRAPEGASVVSPLTTLVTQVQEQAGGSAEQATQQVARALGLPEDTDPAQFDALGALVDGTGDEATVETALQLQATITQLVNLTAVAGAVAAGAGDGSRAAGADAVLDRLAGRIADGGGEGLDLTDEARLADLLRDGLTDAGLAAEAAESLAQDGAAVVSAANGAVVEAREGANGDGLDALNEMARVQVTIQGDAADSAESEAADGSLTDTIEAFTGSRLDSAVALADVDNLPDGDSGGGTGGGTSGGGGGSSGPQPPAAPEITGVTEDTGAASDDGVTTDSSLTLSGTAEAGSTVEVFREGVSLGTTTAAGDGIWSLDFSVAGGTTSLTATATDDNGLTSSASAAFAVTLDQTAPSIQAVAVAPDDQNVATGETIAVDVTFDEAVSASADAEIELTIGDTARQATLTGGDGTATLRFAYTVQDGDADADGIKVAGAIQGTISDLAGNQAETQTFASPDTSGLTVNTLSGSASDPLLRGALVFADADDDGAVDAAEASTTTSATGGFTLAGGEGPLVLQGGTDIATGLPFQLRYTAPEGYSVINPVTTLVQTLAGREDVADVAAAESALANAGLPEVDFSSFDPFAAVSDSPDGAVAYQQAAAQIAILTTLTSTALDTLDDGVGTVAASVEVFAALAAEVVASGRLSFDAATVQGIVADAAQRAQVDLAGNGDAITDLVVAGAARVEAITASGEAALEEIARVQRVSQGDAAETLAANLNGDGTADLDAFQGDNLDTAVQNETVGTVVPANVAIAADQPDGVLEGAEGETTDVTFTVTRGGDTSGEATVDWQVVTGPDLDPADFGGDTLPSGTVIFKAGDTEQTVTVTLAGDEVIEPDAPFAVVLDNPGDGVRITDGRARSAVKDDDPNTPVQSVPDELAVRAGAPEGVPGLGVAYFNDTDTLTVTLNPTNGAVGLSQAFDPGQAGVETASLDGGALELSGTRDAVNAALRAVVFTGTSGNGDPGALAMTTTVSGRSVSDSDSFDIRVADAPEVALPDGPVGLTAGQGTALDGLSVADADGDALRVALAPADGLAGVDIGIADPGQATLRQSDTGQVVLEGTPAEVNAALQGLELTAGAGATGGALDVTVSDGDSLTLDARGRLDVAIDPDAPTLAITDTDQAAAQSNAVGVSGIKIADTDSDSLTVTLTATAGTLSAAAAGGASVDGADSATLTVTGAPDAVNATLEDLTFTADADATEAGLDIKVADGDAATPDATGGVAFTVLENTPPALGGNLTLGPVKEDAQDASITLTPDTLTDADGGTPSAIRILEVDGGTLAQADGSALATGTAGDTLDLTKGSVALGFTPEADLDTQARIAYTVVDPADSSLNSQPSVATVDLNPVNDAPEVGPASGGAVFEEDGGPVTLGDTLTLADIDSDNLSGATIEITTGAASGDVLKVTAGNGITLDTNASTDTTLVLTGNAPLADYQSTLRSLTFDSTSDTPGNTPREIQVTVTDADAATSQPAVRTVEVVPTNDAPSVTGLTDTSFTEGGGAVAVAAGGTITDPDSDMLERVEVRITGNYVPGEDLLSIASDSLPSGVDASFDVASGTLALRGEASVSEYQTALRAINYDNLSDAPTTQDRGIAIEVTDAAGATSDAGTLALSVAGVNDAPTLDLDRRVDGELSLGPIIDDGTPLSEAVLDDVDDTALTKLSVTGLGTGDTLSLSDAAQAAVDRYGLTVSGGDGGDLTVTASGDAPVEGFRTVLQGLTFDRITGTDPFTVTVDDGTDTATATLSFTTATFLQTTGDTLTVDSGATDAEAIKIDLLDDTADVAAGGLVLDPTTVPDAKSVNGSASPVELSLRGDDGANTLTGSAQDDRLQGQGGDDTLDGSGGADVLGGGAGADTLTGGAGVDSFFGTLASLAGDTITDFQAGERILVTDRAASELTLTTNVAGGQTAVTLDDGGSTVTLTLEGSFDNLGVRDTAQGAAEIVTAIVGTPNDDTLVGTDNDDVILGLDGADVLDGKVGGDTLDGGDNLDTLIGGPGDDTLIGGPAVDDRGIEQGFDRADFSGAPASVSVDLGQGAASDGFGGRDTLSGIEVVIGSKQDDSLKGGASDYFEEFRPGAGNDTVDGAGGFDAVSYQDIAGTGITADLGAGQAAAKDGSFTDTLIDIDRVIGTRDADTLTGSDANDSFRPLEGDDDIRGGAGNDRVEYVRLQSDVGIDIDLAGGTAEAKDGSFTDTLSGIESVRGSLGADVIQGDAEHNQFDPLDGADEIHGGDGFDLLRFANDIFYSGGANGVTLDLAAGTATDPFGNQDTFTGIEAVQGNRFNDILRGDDGSNEFMGLGGDDVLDGRGGFDTVRYSSDRFWRDQDNALADSGVTVDLAAGTATDGAGDIDSLIGIERAIGTVFQDTLTGDANHNRLRGLDGADTLTGGGANDVFEGDLGGLDGDTITDLTTEDAIEVFDVAPNDLTISASNPNAGRTELTLGNGAGDSATITLTNGEFGASDFVAFGNGRGGANIALVNTTGTMGDDRLRGSDSDDTLDGMAGNDRLEGFGGADTLIGGEGFDAAIYRNSPEAVQINLATGVNTGGDAEGDIIQDDIEVIEASPFDDTLTGNNSRNIFNGREGADTLTGGGGVDQFDGQLSELNGDTITDFSVSDHIQIFDVAASDLTISTANPTAGETELTLGDGTGDSATVTLTNGEFGASDFVAFGNGHGGSNIALVNTTGTTGDDRLRGGNGDDVLEGLAGHDTLEGFGGADVLSGGDGFDGATYRNSPEAVQINLATGVNTGGHAEGDVIQDDIEEIQGSRFADTLVGDDSANRLRGYDGADTLTGNAGEDDFVGDLAEFNGDTIRDFSVEDKMVVFDVAPADLTISTANPTASETELTLGDGTGDSATVTLTNGEFGAEDFDSFDDGHGNTVVVLSNITGTSGDDVLIGNSGDNTISGLGGDDAVLGSAGADEIDGGSGKDLVFYGDSPEAVTVDLSGGTPPSGGHAEGDTLISIEDLAGTNFNDVLIGDEGMNLLDGGPSDDNLQGNGGDDVLVGGGGFDILTGGAGADTFVFADGDTTLADGGDIIEDFEDGQDLIDLGAVTTDGSTPIAFADLSVQAVDTTGDTNNDALEIAYTDSVGDAVITLSGLSDPSVIDSTDFNFA